MALGSSDGSMSDSDAQQNQQLTTRIIEYLKTEIQYESARVKVKAATELQFGEPQTWTINVFTVSTSTSALVGRARVELIRIYENREVRVALVTSREDSNIVSW